MKYLLLILFFIGCATVPPSYPDSFIKVMDFLPTSNGSYYLVEWQCQQEMADRNMAWIECRFINNSEKIKNTCIEILYSNSQNEQVMVSNRVCSGELAPSMKAYANTIFMDDKLKFLNKNCKVGLELCHMSTRKIN